MKKFLIILLSAFTLLFTACESWMQDDAFYSDIEHDVKVANATQISVYVRYANTRQGKTTPEGFSTFKVDVPQAISATTEMEYGFVRWVAFPQTFIQPARQNSTLYFVDDDDYETNFAPYELSTSEVSFDNPTSPSTNATVKASRSDIYIIPLVAQRPTVGLSIPGSGETNVVKNTSVRINFTKPMDRDSFMNSDFEWDKISVTEGTTTSDANGDIDVSSRDISSFKPANWADLDDSDPAKTMEYIFESPTFSTSQKTITLKFTEEALANGFTSNAKVSVKVSKDVTDIFGFNMTNDEKINFTIGNGTDILAPRIKQLSGGMFNRIVQNSTGEYEFKTDISEYKGRYKNHINYSELGAKTKMITTGSLDGSDEIWTQVESKNVSDTYWNGSDWTYLKTKRVGNRLVLRVEAADITATGNDQTEQELDVASIGMRARPVYLAADGASASRASYYTTNDGYSPATPGAYGPQRNLTDMTGSYADIISQYPEGTYHYSNQNGCLIEYDLSGIPDGLLQIDVWAMDVIGNSGKNAANTAASEANSWASIFVVKDSSAPIRTGTILLEYNGTTFDSTESPFFNEDTYKDISIPGDTSGLIQDENYSTANLASAHNTLKWIVRAFEDEDEAMDTSADTGWTKQLSPIDTHWKSVESDTDFSSFAAPSGDGEITLACALMDELGNISDPINLRKINYDNTAPEITDELSWTPSGDAEAGVDNASVLSEQTLVIPVKEKNPGTDSTLTSGIKCITLDIQKRNDDGTYGTSYAQPFGPDGSGLGSAFTVIIDGSVMSNARFTVSGKTLECDSWIVENYLRNCETNIKITGINISDPSTASAPEGIYKVTATLTDAAGNSNTATNDSGTTNVEDTKVTLSVDSTAPAISRMYIPDVMKVKRASDGSIENWVKYNSTNFTQPNASAVVAKYVYFTFTEENSGAKVFDFTGTTMSFTTTTKFYKVNSVSDVTGTLLAGSFDSTKKVYTLTEGLHSTPADAAAGTAAVPVTVLVTDVQMSFPSQLKLQIKDRAKKVSTQKTVIESDNGNTNISQFNFDTSYPSVSTISLVDKETETGCPAAESGYTNDQYIKANVTLYPSASGINSLTIDGDAVFEEGTTTFSDSTGTVIPLSYVYDSADPDQYAKTVVFKYSDSDATPAIVGTSGSTASRVITITNLKLCRSDNSHADGSYTVRFVPKSFAGREDQTAVTSRKSSAIVLDTKAPEWEKEENEEKGVYSDVNSTYVDSRLVYPTPKAGVNKWGITGIGSTAAEQAEFYFYKNSSTDFIQIVPAVSDINDKAGYNFIEYKRNGSVISNTERYICTSTAGVYTVTARDKAGNISTSKTFHIVNDAVFTDTIASELCNFMTLTPPAGASIFKNTAQSQHKYNTSSHNFSDTNYDTNLYTYDWIYKETDAAHPYKIRIKIGETLNTVTGEKTFKDTDFDTTSKFSRTEASATYAPITHYAVSHWYSSYPCTSGTHYGDSFNAYYPYDTNIGDSLRVSSTDTKHKWYEYKSKSNSDSAKTTDSDIVSYVDKNGDIVIELSGGKMPPLTLQLKDGCGNVIQQMIKPNSTLDGVAYANASKGVAWISDGSVGLEGYTGTVSYGYSTDYGTKTLIVDHDTYNGETTNFDVSFYRTNTPDINHPENKDTAYIQISNLKDNFLFTTSEEGSEDIVVDATTGRTKKNYSLKSRVLAWTSSGTPGDSAFDGSGSNLSEWYYWKQSSSTSPITLKPKFPEYDSTNSYELWYVIEDTVGNRTEPAKLINSTINSSKWLFDNTPPAAVARSVVNVNNIGGASGTNYYNNVNSSVICDITESGSGLKHNGEQRNSYTTFANRDKTKTNYSFPVYNQSPVGTSLSIANLEDWAGNAGTDASLSYNGCSEWVRQTSAPVIETSGTNKPGTDLGESNGVWASFTTTDGNTLSITSKAANTSINVKLAVTDTTYELLGWVITTSPITSFQGFYSVNNTNNPSEQQVHMTQSTVSTGYDDKLTYDESSGVYSYTFTKSDTNKTWAQEYSGEKYFYPVNRAGMIGHTPVKVVFEKNPIPKISSSGITYSNVTLYTSGAVTDAPEEKYIKSDSTMTVTAEYISTATDPVPSDYALYYKIYDGTTNYANTVLPSAGVISLPSTVPAANTTNTDGKALKFKLYYKKTGISDPVEESQEYNLTGHNGVPAASGNEHWYYDNTKPAISITPGTGNNVNIKYDATNKAVHYADTYWLKSDNAIIPYSTGSDTTDREIASITMQTKTGDNDWTDTVIYQNEVSQTGYSVDKTNKLITVPAPETATSYRFIVKDRAGNVQETATTAFKLRKDAAAPVRPSADADFYSLRKESSTDNVSTDYYRITTNDSVSEILYNTSEVEMIVFKDVTDNASGVKRLYYKDADDATNTLVPLTNLSIGADGKVSATLAFSDSLANKTLEIYAEDNVLNAPSAPFIKIKLVPDGTAPNLTISNIQTRTQSSANGPYASFESGGTYYLSRDRAIITYTSTNVNDIEVLEMRSKTGTDDWTEWSSVTAVESSAFDSSTGTVWDKTNKKFKFVSPTDRTEYQFRVTDKVGHVYTGESGTPVSVTLEKDSSKPVLTGDLTATLKNSGAEALISYYRITPDNSNKKTTIKYNPNFVNSIVLDISETNLSDTGSGVNKIYYKDSTEHEITGNTISLANDLNNSTYEIIAKDKVNNSQTIWTYVFTADATVTWVESSYWQIEDTFKKLKGYTPSATIKTVKDNEIGQNYLSNAYPSGTKAIFQAASIVGAVKYKLVTVQETTAVSGAASYTATASASDSDWVELSTITNGTNYEFPLPDITARHTHIALLFMDEAGNVSEPFYLGNPGDYRYQWWLVEQTLTADNITITSSPAAYAAGTTNYTLTIALPEGMILSSVTAENAQIDGKIEFSAYTHNGSGSSAYSWTGDSTGDSGWIYIPTMTVKLKNVSNASAKIKINGVEKAVFPAGSNPNINGLSTSGIIPAGTTESSVVKLNSGTSDNSRSGARFIQFFNNVQNVFTRNNEYEETSYNPAANAEAVELPVAETKKKSAKRTSAKPADVVAAVTEMATTVAEKGSVSEVELPVQVEELTETVEQSVTPVAEAVEPAPVTSSEDFVTQSTPSSVLPFLILLLVFGAFGSFVLMFIRKIKK